MKKKLITAVLLVLALTGTMELNPNTNYIVSAKSNNGSAYIQTTSPVEKYGATIKAILSKNGQAISADQKITQVEAYKLKKSTILWVIVMRSESPMVIDQYLIDTSGKILRKEKSNTDISNMVDQAFVTEASKIFFFEYSENDKSTNIVEVNSNKVVKAYAYKDLSQFEYNPDLMLGKNGEYIFYNQGYSNGASGGPGLTLVAKLDTTAKKFITKYKYDGDDVLLDKSKSLWLLDSTTDNNTDITYKIYKVVNNKKVLKYTVKYKNTETDIPMAWINARLKVVSDKEVYIRFLGYGSWTRVK